MECFNCESDNIKQKDSSLVCGDCGYRQNYVQEDVETNFSQSHQKSHRVNMPSQMSLEDKLNKHLNHKTGDQRPLDQPAKIAKDILSAFQKVLLKQADSIISHYKTEPSLKLEWPKTFKLTLGKLWISFLTKWIEEGWASKSSFEINFTEKKFSYFNKIKNFYDGPRKIDHGRKMTNRARSFTKKPKPVKIFHFKNFTDLRSIESKKEIEKGDLCIEMTLAFVYITLVHIGAPVTLSELLHLVETNVVPYFGLRELFGMRLRNRLDSVQITNRQLLSDFFIPRNVPSVYIMQKMVEKLKKYLKGKICLREKYNDKSILASFCERLYLPKQVLKIAINAIEIWDFKEKNCNFAIKSDRNIVILMAFVVFAANLVFGLNINTTAWQKICNESDDTKMHKIQWTLSKISKPDGFEFHKKALFKNKHKKALLEQINKDNKPGKVLKKLLYKEGKRTFRENNYFGLYYKSTKKSCFDGAYIDFLGACCRLINCSRGILFRVLNKIESKMEIAERVLSFKNEQKEISPIYKERSVNLRKKMKLIGPVKKRGPLRFLRKWQNLQNGDFYYDCLCNNMVPTKIFTNARKHLYKTTCLVN